MSKIPQDFINNIGFLYESISLEEKDFMNEESEHYDAEAVEIVEEIISSISLSMICEGYSASSIISFLADSSDQNIIEKYLNFDENLIAENNIPEEYILEQIEILEQVSNLIVERRGVANALKGLKGLFSTAKRAPALKSAGPLSPNAATRLAMKGKPTLLQKAKVGTERLIGPKGRKAVQAVQDFGSKAKAALPTVAKAALVGGLGVLGGYAGAKLAGGGSGQPGVPGGGKEGPDGDAGVVKDYAAFRAGGGGAKSRKTGMNIRDVEALGRKNLAAVKAKGGTPAAPAAPSGNGGGSGGGGGGGRASGVGGGGKSPATPAAPAKPTDGAERRTPTSLELRRAQEERAAALAAGKSKEEAEKAAVQAGIAAGKSTQGPELTGAQKSQAQASVNADLTKSNTKAELEKPAPAGSALAAEQERRKKQQQAASSTTSESYDAYDIVLEYLINTYQVETLDEAHYVMLEMDSETIGTIVEASMTSSNPKISREKANRQRPPSGAMPPRPQSKYPPYPLR